MNLMETHQALGDASSAEAEQGKTESSTVVQRPRAALGVMVSPIPAQHGDHSAGYLADPKICGDSPQNPVGKSQALSQLASIYPPAHAPRINPRTPADGGSSFTVISSL